MPPGPDPVAVGIDVGGTKLLAALVAGDGRVLARERVRTPTGDEDALVDTVAGLARRLDDALPVGVGIAGIVDTGGTLRYSPNLRIGDVPLGARLEAALGRPVVVKNDATVALYGEYRAGAGRGAEHLLMLTLGTGVGGAVLVAGQVLDGAHGFAGELGHVIVVEGGRPCPCGNRGCLEAYASGTAMGARAAERLGDGSLGSSLREVPPGELVGKHVTNAANDGDRLAQEVLAEAGTWLGVGAANLVNVLDPERVLVGGGASVASAEWVLPAAETSMRERILGAAHRPLPDLRLAALGDDAGIIGAAMLAAGSAP